jgi:hypothetical protein
MDWLADPRICMRPMRSTPRGAQAYVSADMRYAGSRAFGGFIIDSGATFSFAPLSWASLLLGREGAELESLVGEVDVRDVHGKRPRGLRLEVELTLWLDAEKDMLAGWNPRPRIQESIYFCQGFRHGLLGQSAFFEKFGVVFLNFPAAREGRRFGLFRP